MQLSVSPVSVALMALESINAVPGSMLLHCKTSGVFNMVSRFLLLRLQLFLSEAILVYLGVRLSFLLRRKEKYEKMLPGYAAPSERFVA